MEPNAAQSPTSPQATTIEPEELEDVRLQARDFRQHFDDVHRLVLFGLRKHKVQRLRHLNRDEFDDLVSFIWLELLEREATMHRLTCSLASAVLSEVPIAVHQWRHSLKTWQLRCHTPWSVFFDDDERLTELDKAELAIAVEVEAVDEVLAGAEMMRLVERAIASLADKRRECVRRMLDGQTIVEIAKEHRRSVPTTRRNVLLAVTQLRRELFGSEVPECTTLEPSIVSSRVKSRRARSNKYWRKLSDVQQGNTPDAGLRLTPENEWGGRKPAVCLVCDSAERKHKARGLCWRCYHRIATGQVNGRRLVDFDVILDTSTGAHTASP
jgi:DNA-directed RNA polymerase specialized sigma24 family protein